MSAITWKGRSGRWRRIGAAALLALAALAASACSRVEGKGGHDDHAEGETHAEAFERGPRGGRLFADDAIRLELLIEEEGIPPEFRAYLYAPDGRPITPAQGTLSVVLDRFGGRRDSLAFRAEGDRFRSVRPVVEPHSFAASIVLERDGRRHTWSYEQEEGRVELAPEAVASAGFEVGVAGPRTIEVRVEAPGEVRLNAERVVQVRPRFAGLVRSLSKRLGDAVRPGDLLATVHSNESLSDYTIEAPMAGTVVSRDVAEGQAVDHETVLYTVADLSTVWVDFALYPQIASRVRRGQDVRITSDATASGEAVGTISYVGPLLEQDTRVSYGRVVLRNAGNAWQPGLFVSAAITVDRARVAVAVPEEAIVRTSRGPAVFRAAGTAFELQPVTPGRSDGPWTEIVDGLEPGAGVVVRNAFLLKAELGKSEATHDH
jgi:cobalt-zinc-cadmium efflux system membrane fusion protein